MSKANLFILFFYIISIKRNLSENNIKKRIKVSYFNLKKIILIISEYLDLLYYIISAMKCSYNFIYFHL